MGTERTMFFTTGKHMYYEHLMKQVPNFDKVCLDERQLPENDRELIYKKGKKK